MRKCCILAAILSGITSIAGFVFAQNTIDVVVQGISDGVKNSRQIDRDEAIMDAKLKAIEQAGVDISSVTTVENFQLKKDWIESKAKASILPGFQIVEVGYAADGLYHVVLSGKVTATSKSAKPSDNPAGIEFVFIKGGTFQMGDTFGDGDADEKPVHEVTVTDFYMGKTEVTVAQYRIFCSATGRSMPSAPSWRWKDNDPIVNVSWDDAEVFCQWVGGRLPTEAEWEYSARGGNKSNRFKYCGGNFIDDIAWYESNSGSTTHPVGMKKCNELGLYDMSGNVWEWCLDRYDQQYYHKSTEINPQGPSSGYFRVLRGGSWDSDPKNVRCVNRNKGNSVNRNNCRGFRITK